MVKSKVVQALLVLAVLLGFGVVIGYTGGKIATGITDIANAFRVVFASGAFLLALGLGGAAVYLFGTRFSGNTITRKQLPLLAIAGLSILFLQFGSRLSVFSVIDPTMSIMVGVNVWVALALGAGAFIAGLAIFAKGRRLF